MLPSRAVIELDEEEIEKEMMKEKEKEKELEKLKGSVETKMDVSPIRAMAPPGVWMQAPPSPPASPQLHCLAPTLAPQQLQLPPGTWDNKQDSDSQMQCVFQEAVVQHTPLGTPPRRPVLDCPAEGKTTVVIRNFPHSYTRDKVCELLNSKGFHGCYDFVYLPTDFLSWMAFGYAFINMKTHEDALRVMDVMEGFSDWGSSGGKECNVVWSDPYQGLAANIERYRNSPVMGSTVHEMYKPLLILDGKVAQFPAPTKKLNPPRVRRSSQYSQIRASIEVN
jgi:RNA recognition motif-containing protein